MLINSFWGDLASHLLEKNGESKDFLSENFIYAITTHTEMILALAISDIAAQGSYE